MKILVKVEVGNDEHRFLRSQVIYTDGKNYYLGKSSTLTPEEIDERNVASLSSILIPHQHIFPLATEGITTVERGVAGRYFVKKPDMLGYNAKEAQVYCMCRMCTGHP